MSASLQHPRADQRGIATSDTFRFEKTIAETAREQVHSLAVVCVFAGRISVGLRRCRALSRVNPGPANDSYSGKD